MPDFSNILFSAGCDSGVVKHCMTVAEAAKNYSGDSVDDNLVYAGSMMHDIGRSVTHSIKHAQKGAKICRELGCPCEITEIVRCHTGAGLTEDECVILGLHPLDCVPKTLEEKIVAHADNLVKGSRIVTLDERMMLASDLSKRARRNIWRLGMEVELLRK